MALSRKKRIDSAWWGILLLAAVVLVGSCNFGVPEYNLSVLVGAGVTGTPASGEYSYSDQESVAYNYYAVNPLHIVEVFIGNSRKESVGGITMYGNNSITAQLMDIRGTWNMQMWWDGAADPSFDFNITFEGNDLISGSFRDSRGFHGTWVAENGEISIIYTDWNDFILEGGQFGMNGIFTGDASFGTWSATLE